MCNTKPAKGIFFIGDRFAGEFQWFVAGKIKNKSNLLVFHTDAVVYIIVNCRYNYLLLVESMNICFSSDNIVCMYIIKNIYLNINDTLVYHPSIITIPPLEGL